MHAKDLKINLLLDYYGDTLTSRQKEVMDLYYNEDMSLFEISEHVGVTRQGVHDLIKRSESSLLELDEKLGFIERFEQIRRASLDIEDAIEKAEALNSKNLYSSELKEITDKLKGALLVLRQDEEPASEV